MSKHSGYDLYPRRIGSDGAVLLGRVVGIADGRLALADDVNPLLDEADKSCAEFIAAADLRADRLGLAPAEGDAPPPLSPRLVKPILSLYLRDAGVTSIVWATGYDVDFNWVKLPVFDRSGRPLQNRGVPQCPGIYFLGLHWIHTFGSGLLSYVGRDAAFLADHIDKRLQ